MRSLILSLFILINLPTGAQNNTIAAGEKLTFTASYNMSGLLTDIAQVTMPTLTIIETFNVIEYVCPSFLSRAIAYPIYPFSFQ